MSTYVTVHVITNELGLPQGKTMRVDDFTEVFKKATAGDLSSLLYRMSKYENMVGYFGENNSVMFDEKVKVMSIAGTCLWDSHMVHNKLKAWEKKGWRRIVHPRKW
jgi:hypothetical protein